MRSGDARKNFPTISINNVITLATRVRITLLKVLLFLAPFLLPYLIILCVLMSSLLIGYGRGLSKASSQRVRHRDAVPEPPGDSSACREEPQTDHHELRRGYLFASNASPYRRVAPVIRTTIFFTYQVVASHYLYVFSQLIIFISQACIQSLFFLQ